jgi:hypothetical protein
MKDYNPAGRDRQIMMKESTFETEHSWRYCLLHQPDFQAIMPLGDQLVRMYIARS